MWIEIFKGGQQTDSAGVEHDGDALIDKAVAGFNAAEHHPPLCLGHPKDDSPAYGWVDGVKAKVVNGIKRLYADVSPVEALKGWVKAGLYRQRSSAFYPDGRLRHVGFLGGTPPAVKGLAPLPAFADGAGGMEFIEHMDGYSQSVLARMLRRLREWIIEEKGSDTADRLIGDWEIEEIGRRPEPPEEVEAGYADPPAKGDGEMKFSEWMKALRLFREHGGKDEDIDVVLPPTAPVSAPADGKTFSEADLEAAKKAAAEEAKTAAEAKFAEAEAKRAKAARKGEIAAFVEAGIKNGTIAPAWKAAGIGAFMEQLSGEDGQAMAFSEAGEKKTPDAWFREFLGTLPKLIDFGEIATRDKNVAGGDAGGKLETLTRQKMVADKSLTYSAAFSEVQREHPDLAQEYAAEIG